MKKFFDFINERRYLVYIFMGIILFTMVFKSQVVILTYGEEYTVRLEYTMYGYCIRAAADKKAAEPVVYNDFYIGSSISNSVKKAVTQLENLSDTDETVMIKAMGFPRNNEKLEAEIKHILEETGRTVELLDNAISK